MAPPIPGMILECEDNIHRLSAWEQNFIIDISDQYDTHERLTQAQEEKLKEIYDRVMS